MMYGELPPRAYELQSSLNKAYEQAMQPGLSWREERALDKRITAMECELDEILQNAGQARTPGGYYTPEGVKLPSGQVSAQPALVLAPEDADEKKRNPFPWILLALIAAGTTYYSVKG